MTGTYPFENYRVLFTPLVAANTYGSTVDVTQDIDLTDFLKSVGDIVQEIEGDDGDIGIFTFGNISLSAINYDRKFNDANDALSIFPYKRDRCKVEIKFYDADGTAQTRFKGLINDDATRHDFRSDTVRFTVLSLESILRQVKVPAGSIVNGDLFSTAIKKILNVPEVAATLTYNAANINVDLDLAIDDGEVFSNTVAWDSIKELLLASNSIMYVDGTDTIYVKDRAESANTFNLYGHADKYGRQNIIEVKDINTGLHRAFSSVKVNSDTVSTSDGWADEYGFRQKSMSFDFITDATKEEQIASNILASFQVPRPELEIKVPSKAVTGMELLDRVLVDYPYRTIPDHRDSYLPMLGSDELGSFHLPQTIGSFRILPKVKWKVMRIAESPRDFTTTLMLRQAGTAEHEGYF